MKTFLSICSHPNPSGNNSATQCDVMFRHLRRGLAFMTWKRVATAAVLIPVVVGLVLWGSTIVVALVVALVMLLALFEYFALGDAIGHRAHRFWTATCALIILYLQWLTTAVRWGEFGGITYPARLAWLFHRFFPRAED